MHGGEVAMAEIGSRWRLQTEEHERYRLVQSERFSNVGGGMKTIVEAEPTKDGPVNTFRIGVDREAIGSLIRSLDQLKGSNVGEHIHFMAEEWGLGDLIAKPRNKDNSPIHHLVIELIE